VDTMIWVARLETRCFQFEGVGRTEDEARGVVREAWKRHVLSFPPMAQASMYTFAELEEDVVVEWRIIGVPYRDGEEI